MEQVNENFHRTLVENILKILNTKGLIQADLVALTGWDKSVVSRIISGRRGFDVNELSKIATVLEMPILDIITYPDKYVRAGSPEQEPLEAILQIRLKKDKKDQVLRLVFGDNNIEILNK
jgi:transcriptional regulator with XRE-family HTH domain